MRGLDFAISFLKTTTAKVFVSAVLIFVFGMGNFMYPVILFSNEIYNEVALILILSMPVIIFFIFFSRPNPWVQIVSFICLAPIILVCFIIQLITGSYLQAAFTKRGDTHLKPQKIYVNGSEIYWHDPSLMPGSSFGVIVQQERPVLPGILFVRHLYVEDPVKKFNSIEIAGPDSVRIVMRDSAKPDLIIPVRRFVWF